MSGRCSQRLAQWPLDVQVGAFPVCHVLERSSLQVYCEDSCEVSAGVQRGRWKTLESCTTNGTRIDPKCSCGPGGRQGVPGNQQKYEKIKKGNADTNMRNISLFMCGDFLKKNKRRAQRLGVYQCFMNKK